MIQNQNTIEISMPRQILIEMLKDAAELGANSALTKAGLIKPFMSKSEAYRVYGETNVDRWISEQLLTATKDGGHSAKWRIDRVEIETVSKASNSPSYKMVKERKLT